jgi:hypothetical protein
MPFKHEQNLSELTDLPNRLRTAPSGVEMKGEETAADIAGRIKELRAEHTVEPAPEPEARQRGRGAVDGPDSSPNGRWSREKCRRRG